MEGGGGGERENKRNHKSESIPFISGLCNKAKHNATNSVHGLYFPNGQLPTEVYNYLLRFQMMILVPFLPIIASSSATNFCSVENRECSRIAARLAFDSAKLII